MLFSVFAVLINDASEDKKTNNRHWKGLFVTKKEYWLSR